MFVAVHHQELACKETDSALKLWPPVEKDKRYFLNETRDKKGHRRKAGREREKKEIEGESAKAIEKRTW